MPSFLRLTRRNGAAGAAVAAFAGVVALSGAASAVAAPAAPQLPKPGTDLINNGYFYKPGPAKHEGRPPLRWKLVFLGAERHPYNAGIGVWNANGKYPPPHGNPDKSDIADEIFYEGGGATGIEGIGGQQTPPRSITQKNHAYVAFDIVANEAPQAKVAKWAGDGVEIVFAAGKHTDTLVYFSPWQAYKSKFSSKPHNSATFKYIFSKTLRTGVWYRWRPHYLNHDIKKEFGVTVFKVLVVRFVDLEDTTSPNAPYPNEDGYIADLGIWEGK